MTTLLPDFVIIMINHLYSPLQGQAMERDFVIMYRESSLKVSTNLERSSSLVSLKGAPWGEQMLQIFNVMIACVQWLTLTALVIALSGGCGGGPAGCS
jgi:hypothetical protein